MTDNTKRVLDEEYRKLRNSGVTHQEAMERLRIASAKAVKQAARKILGYE